MNFPIGAEILTRALKCSKSDKHALLSFTEITKAYQSVPDGQRSHRPLKFEDTTKIRRMILKYNDERKALSLKAFFPPHKLDTLLMMIMLASSQQPGNDLCSDLQRPLSQEVKDNLVLYPLQLK